MDPNAALDLILKALKTGEMYDEASWAADGLADWLAGRGFKPSAGRIAKFTRAVGRPLTPAVLRSLAKDFEKGA